MRVLVVDNEALMRWSIAQTLGDLGCVVVEAEDGEAGVAELARSPCPFDVIVLDPQLDDSNDLTLVTTFQKLAWPCRIILVTAFSTPQVTQSALELGVDHVLSKPFELAELARLVRQPPPVRRH